MAHDLPPSVAFALEKAEKKAAECLKKGNNKAAAASYQKAAELLFEHAGSCSRDVEIALKKKGIEYRELAKKLLSGQVRVATTTTGERKEISFLPVSDEIRAAVSQLIHSSHITWDEIGGLEDTKNEIKYALGISVAKKPPGMRLAGWRNMLFYGPPGTGKTLLAAATSNALKSADGTKAVFFNVKVSSVMSKYFGESTKIISELYGMARDMSPAVIFLDEFESLCPSRDSDYSGTERRILSTILSELDGLAEKGREDIYVLSIAATNRPWDMDEAVLSRFEKKILIPLPDSKTRRKILEIHLDRKGFKSQVPYERLVDMTVGFSGREIEQFCKGAISRMLAEMNREIPALVDKGLDVVSKYDIRIRHLTEEDFEAARGSVVPQTTPDEMARYESWGKTLE